MKRLFFAAAIVMSCLALKSSAQVSLNVGINIGSQPDWGPVGYDRADYYYMPDIDAYYSVPTHQYIYLENNTWVRRASLPPRYSNYNVYNGYKVVINDRDPWLRNNVYRTKYAGYKGRKGQNIIRDSKDAKYRNNGDNGKHKGWDKQDDRGRGNGNGKGHGNDKGHGHGRD